MANTMSETWVAEVIAWIVQLLVPHVCCCRCLPHGFINARAPHGCKILSIFSSRITMVHVVFLSHFDSPCFCFLSEVPINCHWWRTVQCSVFVVCFELDLIESLECII